MNTLTRAQDTATAPRDDKRAGEALQPPVDVIEDPTGITLYADMPGVPRDKLQLRVEGDQLLLDGEIELADDRHDRPPALVVHLHIDQHRPSQVVPRTLTPASRRPPGPNGTGDGSSTGLPTFLTAL